MSWLHAFLLLALPRDAEMYPTLYPIHVSRYMVLRHTVCYHEFEAERSVAPSTFTWSLGQTAAQMIMIRNMHGEYPEVPMQKTNDSGKCHSRVVLVNGSLLLREMITRVFSKLPDFEIVGTVEDPDGLEPSILTTEADWLVVLTMPEVGVSERIKALRTHYPDLSILAISADGSEVFINWLEPQNIHMERASLLELIAMMRSFRRESQV